jgi:hypothetical protein
MFLSFKDWLVLKVSSFDRDQKSRAGVPLVDAHAEGSFANC